MHPLVLVGLGLGVGEGWGFRVRGGVGIRQSGSDFNEEMHNLAGVQISAQHRRQTQIHGRAFHFFRGARMRSTSLQCIISLIMN